MIRLFLFLVLFFSSSQLVAKDSLYSASNMAREIEKAMLFDEESRSNIDFYKQDQSSKKEILDIVDETFNQDSRSPSKVEIKVIKTKKFNLNIREKERLAYNAALVDQNEVAIELYKQVIKAEPKNNYAKYSLAIIYQKMHQFLQAKKLYRNLLKNSEYKRQEVIDNLLTLMVEESPKEAVYLLSRLAAQNPGSANILAKSAIAYERTKNYEMAQKMLIRAIDLDPNNIHYKYNLAIIYDKAKKYDNAVELYSYVTQSYNNDPSIPIDQIKERIEIIKNKA